MPATAGSHYVPTTTGNPWRTAGEGVDVLGSRPNHPGWSEDERNAIGAALPAVETEVAR